MDFKRWRSVRSCGFMTVEISWVSRSIDVFLWVFDGGDQCGFLNRQVVVWVSGLVVVCVGFGGWHGLLWLWLWWWLLAGGRWFARM